MSFSITPATLKEKPLLHALLQPYLDELSTFPGEAIDYKDEDGLYHYPYLDAYWQEEGTRYPYLLYSDKDLAGFALVRKTEDHYEIAEYYVKPEFRHLGLGRTCAAALLNNHPGAWRIEFNRHNQSSRNLWKNMAQRFASGKITKGKTGGAHDFLEFSVSPTNDIFQYYNERAPEYEAFYAGEFPTGPRRPELYKTDIKAIQRLLPDYISGNCIDIACGTGFWLPSYHQNYHPN
jgi:predicted acetyltransferase